RFIGPCRPGAARHFGRTRALPRQDLRTEGRSSRAGVKAHHALWEDAQAPALKTPIAEVIRRAADNLPWSFQPPFVTSVRLSAGRSLPIASASSNVRMSSDGKFLRFSCRHGNRKGWAQIEHS